MAMVSQSRLSVIAAQRLISHNVIVGASTLIAGALGFCLQAVLGHRLAPADFGVAFSVLTLLLFIWLPSNAVMLAIARETSRDEVGGRSAAVMWHWHRYLMLGGFAIAALMIMMARPLSQYFSVPAAIFVPAAFSIPFGLAVPLLLGRLQGQQRFTTLSLLLVGQAAVRLICAIACATWLGSIGVLVGIAAGNILVYLGARIIVGRRNSTHQAVGDASMNASRSFAIILPSSLCLATLFGTDVLLAKHFLNVRDAGSYAAVAALGRAIFWGASGIALVLFPKVAFHANRGMNGSNLLLASMGLCLLGSVVGLAALSFGGGLMLEIFAGSAYAAGSSYLGLYAVGMTLFGGVAVLIASWQAQGRGEFLAILVPITVLEPLMIVVFHQSATTVASVVALCMGVLFSSLAVLYVFQERSREVPRVALEAAV